MLFRSVSQSRYDAEGARGGEEGGGGDRGGGGGHHAGGRKGVETRQPDPGQRDHRAGDLAERLPRNSRKVAGEATGGSADFRRGGHPPGEERDPEHDVVSDETERGERDAEGARGGEEGGGAGGGEGEGVAPEEVSRFAEGVRVRQEHREVCAVEPDREGDGGSGPADVSAQGDCAPRMRIRWKD